jgi:hypothetical protein
MTNKALQLISDLRHQTVIGEHTCTQCKCGRRYSRGGGPCALCVRDEIGELIGDAELADAFYMHTLGANTAASDILERGAEK